MTPQDPLRTAQKASRDLLMQYIVDSLKAEEATRAGNQRTIYGQAAFVAGWMEAAPSNVRAALRAARGEPEIDVERPEWHDKGNTHAASLPIGEIVAAIAAMRLGYRINGVWVQYHGDGTDRAKKGEVVVSVQYGWPDAANAADGRGATVREAGYDAIRVLRGQP